MARKRILVRGLVQGIGYRWFVREAAERFHVAGWVRNLPNGDVEADAQGSEEALARFIAELETGHSWARVEKVTASDVPEERGAAGFAIR